VSAVVELGALLVTIIGMLSLTQVGANTSYLLIEIALFVMGLGLGATMMPAMAAAYQTLSRSQVARATSALNIIQRVGASIGIALISVVPTPRTRNVRVRRPHARGMSAADGSIAVGVPPFNREGVPFGANPDTAHGRRR
jgi:hypothetical protein